MSRPSWRVSRRGTRLTGDRGTTIPLIMLCFILAGTLVCASIAASAAFLAQRDLAGVCDGAAIAAANAISRSELGTPGVELVAPGSPERFRGLQRGGSGARRLAGTADRAGSGRRSGSGSAADRGARMDGRPVSGSNLVAGARPAVRSAAAAAVPGTGSQLWVGSGPRARELAVAGAGPAPAPRRPAGLRSAAGSGPAAASGVVTGRAPGAATAPGRRADLGRGVGHNIVLEVAPGGRRPGDDESGAGEPPSGGGVGYLPLDEGAVDRAVAEYQARVLARDLPVQMDAATDGSLVTVTCRRRVQIPFGGLLGHRDGLDRMAVAYARSPLD